MTWRRWTAAALAIYGVVLLGVFVRWEAALLGLLLVACGSELAP